MSEELFWKYMKCGGGETLGDPRTPERVEQVGQGQEIRYRDFHKGTIYWASQTESCVWIEEKILQYWRDMGPARLKLGFPTDDSQDTSGEKYNKFQHGSITYDPVLDKFKVYSGGRSLLELRREIIILITVLICIILVLIIYFAANGNTNQQILTLVPVLLSPFIGILINLLWKQPNNPD